MQFIITSSHKTDYPNPIQFSPGDPLKLGKRDDQYPGWIWVTIPSGNQGWAPEARIRFETEQNGVALSDYTARELNTSEGERVICSDEFNGWLWVENERGQSGWIPKETVSSTSPCKIEGQRLQHQATRTASL